MCLYDVEKGRSFHAFINGLVQHSGMTAGAASMFLACKDPKTNHGVFDQMLLLY